MAKSKTIFVCNQCGFENSKWNGRCQECGAWNSFEETEQTVSVRTGSARKTSDLTDKIMELSEIDVDSDVRYETGIGELDRVLGGGLVKGSLVLLGGAPGIGKSTLLLQVCQYLGQNYSVLYVSGEESARQIRLRADRLGVDTDSLYILTVTDAEAICDTIVSADPDIVIIDSIQTMNITSVTSSPGSLTQVRECTNLFMHTAKNDEIPIIIVGHVNKDGAIAGPKVMEHIVDAVLYFEGERNLSCRILRTVKNRYGSTNEIGVFEMLDKGLCEVRILLRCFFPDVLKAYRVHALRVLWRDCVLYSQRYRCLPPKSGFATPRRMSKGYDFNRMAIIIAVMEKRAGMFFGNLDVYLNVVGGFRIDETAGDLAAAMCLYSGIMDKPLPEGLIAFGEVGLGGEVRAVSNVVQRIKEAERMGFDICVLPKQSLASVKQEDFKIKLAGVSDIKQAFSLI